MKKIVTTKISKDFATSGSVILYQTPEILIMFFPEIHSGGVRGHIVKYKKDKKRKWEILSKDDFKNAEPMLPNTKFAITLPTEAITALYEVIQEQGKIVSSGIKDGKTEYIVAESDQVVVVDSVTKKSIFKSLLEKGYSDEFWDLLIKSEPELATRLSVGHLHSEKIKSLEELKERLKGKYPETTGNESWQRWIYSNKWLMGINYIQAIEKAKVSISGSMPDYLFLTADHFIDILEIKLPEEAVILEDKGHPGSYKWCPVANAAIGQVVYYLGEIDRLQGDLEREILRVYKLKVSFVKPRGFILIGQKDGWDSFKLEAFRKLNFSLHGVEVLTYSDLVQRGAEITKMYQGNVKI